MVPMYSLLDLDAWRTIVSGFDFGKRDWFTETTLELFPISKVFVILWSIVGDWKLLRWVTLPGKRC